MVDREEEIRRGLEKKIVALRCLSVDGNGVRGGDLRVEGKRDKERVQEGYLKWVLGMSWKTPEHMIREEVWRNKLRT